MKGNQSTEWRRAWVSRMLWSYISVMTVSWTVYVTRPCLQWNTIGVADIVRHGVQLRVDQSPPASSSSLHDTIDTRADRRHRHAQQTARRRRQARQLSFRFRQRQIQQHTDYVCRSCSRLDTDGELLRMCEPRQVRDRQTWGVASYRQNNGEEQCAKCSLLEQRVIDIGIDDDNSSERQQCQWRHVQLPQLVVETSESSRHKDSGKTCTDEAQW